MKTMLLAAAVLAAPSFPALAAEPAGPDWVETLPIERMCSAEGALDHRFGSTDLPPRLIQIAGLGRTPLPAGYGPFTHVSLDSTKWSGKFYEAGYAAELDSPEAVLAAIARLAERFEKAGWIALRGEDMDPAAEFSMTDVSPGPGEVMLYSEAEGLKPGSRAGLRVWLSRLGNELTLACTNLPLFGEHVSEALGRLPPGSPRPVEPVLAMPTGMTPAMCDDPARRSQILTFVPESPDPMTSYILRRMNHAERMVVWKGDRLRDSGKVTDERMSEIMLAVLNKPAFAGSMVTGLETALSMMEDVQAIVEGDGRGDPLGQCRRVVGLMGKLSTIAAHVGPQWTIIEEALDQEAARVGVSLD